ncbi:MAG: rhodanese-like domain-containing protein [Nitrospirales bacterium]|nr:rhodanese-like domain-containing protein [Nitrospirales bacterium]
MTKLPRFFDFVVFVLLVSCSEKGLPDMTPEQLLTSIETHSAPVIVDVRSQSEFDSGHVPGAVHLPFYAIWSRHEEANATPEDPIVLYCEHGPRAWIGKFALWTVGYKNIVYLDGHMSGWKQRSLPMTNRAE